MTFSCLGKDGPGRPPHSRNTPEEGGYPALLSLETFPMVQDQKGCKGWGGMEYVFPQICKGGCPPRELWEEQSRGSHSLVYGAWEPTGCREPGDPAHKAYEKTTR